MILNPSRNFIILRSVIRKIDFEKLLADPTYRNSYVCDDFENYLFFIQFYTYMHVRLKLLTIPERHFKSCFN